MIIEYQKNFQGMVGCKMISPHHSHPTNGVRPSDFMDKQNKYDSETEHGTIPDKQDEWNKKYE